MNGVYSFDELVAIRTFQMRGTLSYGNARFKGVREIYADKYEEDLLSLELLDEKGENIGCIIVNDEQQVEFSKYSYGYEMFVN